ncbi:MAG: TolC family protein [Cyclobacteriaceae bacterium]
MKFLILGILAMAAYNGISQGHASVEQAIAQALENNASMKASNFELESQKQLRKTSFNLPKTEITLLYGQYNSYIKNDNNVTISQAIPFSALGSQGSLNRALVTSSEIKKRVDKNEIVHQVKQLYHQLAFTNSRYQLLLRQDSIYEGFLKSASLRYQTGETNLLEQTTAEGQWNESKNQLRQMETEISRLKMRLRTITNSQSFPEIELTVLSLEEELDTLGYKTNPSLAFIRQQIEVSYREMKLQAARFAPDLLIGFFSQTLIGGPVSETGNAATSNDRFTGFQVGIALPLWFAPHQARVKSADFKRKADESRFEYYQTSLQGQLQQAIRELSTYKISLEYYTTSGIPNAGRILKQSQVAFREGEIGYTEYLSGLRNAMSIQEGYLKTLNDYNQSILYIEYLNGNHL